MRAGTGINYLKSCHTPKHVIAQTGQTDNEHVIAQTGQTDSEHVVAQFFQ